MLQFHFCIHFRCRVTYVCFYLPGWLIAAIKNGKVAVCNGLLNGMQSRSPTDLRLSDINNSNIIFKMIHDAIKEILLLVLFQHLSFCKFYLDLYCGKIQKNIEIYIILTQIIILLFSFVKV